MIRQFVVALFVLLSISVSATTFAQETRTLNGTITNEISYVQYPFSVTEENSTIVLDMMMVDGDLDPYLYLINANGQVIAENDDRIRGDSNPRIEFSFAPVGQYIAVATRYGVTTGNTLGNFALTVEVKPTVLEDFNYDTSPEALVSAGFPAIAPKNRAQWTVIAYYGGDNDLEQGVLHDMKEFENAGGSSDNVRVVMMMDRSSSNFVSPDPAQEWNTIKIFELQSNKDASGALIQGDANLYVSNQIAEIVPDEANPEAASGQMLAQYLSWAVQNYPADHYAIAFGSHGAAWEGLIQDDTPTSNDQPDANNSKLLIGIPQLRAALDIAKGVAGVDRFDLLINDACLMSSVEYYHTMSNYFKVSIASPEVVVNPALDMNTLLTLLNTDAQGDTVALARQLVDKYVDVDIRQYNSPDIAYLTHAVTDLTAFETVSNAVDAFAKLYNSDPAKYGYTVGQARIDDTTYVYSGFLGRQTKIDLGDLMNNVINYSPYPELDAAAGAVIDALNRVRLYGKSGGAPGLTNASYYNIYFPADRSYYRGEEYFADADFREWAQVLRNYFNAVNPNLATITGVTTSNFHAPIAPKVDITTLYPLDLIGSIANPITLSGEIVGRGIDHAEVTIDQRQADGTYIRFSTEPFLLDVPVGNSLLRLNKWDRGVDLREISWDVTLPKIYGLAPDGSGTVVSTFEFMKFTEQVASLDAYYREPGGAEWHDVTVIFDNIVGTGKTEGSVVRVVSRSATSEAAANITIPEGSDFVAFRPRVTADGTTKVELSTNYLKWSATGVTYRFEPAPDGDYQLGILATALGGETGFIKRDVKVANSGLDTNFYGDTSQFGGFIMPRGATWQRTLYSAGYATCEQVSSYPSGLELYRTSMMNYGDTSTSADDLPIGNLNNYVLYATDANGNSLTTSDPALADAVRTQLADAGVTLTSDFSATTLVNRPALNFTYSYTTPYGTYEGRGWVTDNTYWGYLDVFTAEILVGGGADLNQMAEILNTRLKFIDIASIESTVASKWGYGEPLNMSLAVPLGKDATDPLDWTRAIDEENRVRYASLGDPNSPTFLEVQQGLDSTLGLDVLASTLAGAGAENFVLGATNVLITPTIPWEAISYTATRNGQPVEGRVYRTDHNGMTYAVWFETPTNDQTATVLTSILEPIVDSIVFIDDALSCN